MSSRENYPSWVSQVKRLADEAQAVVTIINKMRPEIAEQVDSVLVRSEPPFGGCGLDEAIAVIGILRDEVDRVRSQSANSA